VTITTRSQNYTPYFTGKGILYQARANNRDSKAMGSLEIPLCLHEELGPQIYPDTNHRKQKSILLRQINSNCNQKKKPEPGKQYNGVYLPKLERRTCWLQPPLARRHRWRWWRMIKMMTMITN